VERLALLLVVVLFVRTWEVQGLFVPLRVLSGSMAETLRGVHRSVVCVDCGRPFVCGTDVRPVRPKAVCPNCGWAGNDLATPPDVAGDRLLIDKAVFQLRRPRRWELIAFRHPGRPAEVCVKRVIGLPGESIQIRHGDVYVDGRLQRKSLEKQRAMAVLVHDANFTPATHPGPPARWEGAQSGIAWDAAGGRFTHPSITSMTSINWLSYRHWQRTPGGPGQISETPVTNLRGYNQTRPQRNENIHPVCDLMLAFRLIRTFGSGQLSLRANDGRDEFHVRIDPGLSRYEVLRDGRTLMTSARGELPDCSNGIRVELSLFDRQLLLAFDGRPAFVHPYDSPGPERKPSPRPLAIGAQGLGVELGDLRVFRDVYYTRPVGPSARWAFDGAARLGDKEYFVLGDNSPMSDDSRTWSGGPAVPGRLVLGRPFLVHFPSRALELGPWHFQVPDPARIRYIR
jgi:signal peptidase I